MESLPKIVGKNAKAQREKLKLTEPELIKRKVPGGTAHRATNGGSQDMMLSTLAKLAKALELPAWALLVPTFNPDHPPALVDDVDIEAEIERRANERVSELLYEAYRLNVDPEKARPDGRSVAQPFLTSPPTEGGAGSGPEAGRKPGPAAKRDTRKA